MGDVSAKYSFDSQGRFVIENYNWVPAFSSYFPGIAGKWGIPSWCYYLNRGQAVSSLGTKDKDGAILEFLSFNRASQLIGLQGFRTFMRVDEDAVYEPFRKVTDKFIRQRMVVSSHELEIHERHEEKGLEISVLYFPLVNQPVAGLVRQVTITNAGEAKHDFQVLDGAPRVLPYGVTFEHVKVITRHIEAMMGVVDLHGIPMLRLKQTPEDSARIGTIEATNFYLSTTDEDGLLREAYIVDPAVVFGTVDDFGFPWSFNDSGVEELISTRQVLENRTPCAFTGIQRTLAPGERLTLRSVLGHAPSEGRLTRFIEVIAGSGFFEQARSENQDVVARIENTAFTVSAEPLFDRYCQQTFLDNVLRGGMPLTFEDASSRHVFYTYIRQGGDPERDYHWFVLEPTYLSQGNGHYRNVLQNRRMDPWFFPDVGDHNIRLFMNLIQPDGYNPLVINGQTYVAEDVERVRAFLQSSLGEQTWMDNIVGLTTVSFTPGGLVMRLEDYHPMARARYEELLGGLLPLCRKLEIGGLHAGFWIDHWLYNLDMIEVYLGIYPERMKTLLLDERECTFFDDPDVVLPRAQKYVLVDGNVRQFGAVVRDEEKEARIAGRPRDRYKVRTQKGEVYRTSLFVKLLCLVATKLALLDPARVGVEMEAGKPGWCDSLNGLPGMLGSSLCQTLELVRALRFMLASVAQMGLNDEEVIPVYMELADLISGLVQTMEAQALGGSSDDSLVYWEGAHALVETYRERTRLGVDGRERDILVGVLCAFFRAGLDLLEPLFSEKDRKKVFHPNGVPYTYLINEVTAYDALPDEEKLAGGFQHVRPIAFQQRPVALFLEGPVHFLRVFPEAAAQVYARVRNSDIFDTELGMFKSSESLVDQPWELGRIKAYPSGWIENEAVYTHMTYKWLLEVLRSGLTDQFMEDMRATLPPFLAPEQYGRSTLDNCSFIASTAYSDPTSHGRAFQPRQSGVTAEWLQIWTVMVAGENPFSLDEEGELVLRLAPVLPAWLFTEQQEVRAYWDEIDGWRQVELGPDCFAFRFLGRVLMVYHNPSRKATVGAQAVGIVGCTFRYRDGRESRVEGGV
nr:cellobiose phosphorylase [Anaerolineales bacterium]